MDLLFDILKKLKKYEIRSIRNMLKSSPFEYEKVGKLFELVTRYKDKEESFYSQKLYEKEPNNTFRVTKSRLKRLLEDAVLNDKSLTDYSAAYINAMLQSKKRLLQGEILLGRGAYQASRNLLLQVVAQTRKFSLHDEHFKAKLLLHRSQSINMSVKEFQKRSDKLLEFNRISFLVNEAAILHYSVNNIISHQTIDDEAKLKKLEEKIDRIKEVSEITQSPMARYYYLLTIIVYLQYNNRYSQAFEFCKEYLELVENEPSVTSQQRLANAHFQTAEVSLHMANMEAARNYINKTLTFFSKEQMNYLIVLMSAFRVAFFSEDFDEAERIFQEAKAHPRFSVSKMRSAQWHYFHACLQFRVGNVKGATLSLNDATALLSDKMGWNLSFRLLEIMILFEAGHLDLLDTKILNMRQFIKRTQKKSDLYRAMILISILMDWHKNDLDIKKTFPAIQRHLNKLKSFHEEFPFNPTATELIRLESWMEEKYNALVAR